MDVQLKKIGVNNERPACQQDFFLATTQLQRLPIKSYEEKLHKACTKHSKGIKINTCVVFHTERPSAFRGRGDPAQEYHLLSCLPIPKAWPGL